MDITVEEARLHLDRWAIDGTRVNVTLSRPNDERLKAKLDGHISVGADEILVESDDHVMARFDINGDWMFLEWAEARFVVPSEDYVRLPPETPLLGMSIDADNFLILAPACG